MKKQKSLERVLAIVGQHEADRQKEIKALRRLAREGQKSGDALLVGASYYYIAIACRAMGDLDGALTNAHKAVIMPRTRAGTSYIC